MIILNADFMKTILAATDFSPAASNAVGYAADMAMAINARLYLLHVYQIPVSFSELPVSVNLEDMIHDAEKEMEKLAEQLSRKTEGKLNIHSEVRMGVFFPELKTVCQQISPYAVVMGSQGKTATTRFFFGEHAVYAMKHLHWPLITVPPEAGFHSIKKIGLACDFDKVMETIPIDEIKGLVADFQAQLHILNTGKKEIFEPGVVFESVLLQEMLDNLKPSYHFITLENTDEGILDFTNQHQIDLLIVFPKRHNLMQKLLHKSHTKQLVLHSHVPVMAIHQ